MRLFTYNYIFVLMGTLHKNQKKKLCPNLYHICRICSFQSMMIMKFTSILCTYTSYHQNFNWYSSNGRHKTNGKCPYKKYWAYKIYTWRLRRRTEIGIKLYCGCSAKWYTRCVFHWSWILWAIQSIYRCHTLYTLSTPTDYTGTTHMHEHIFSNHKVVKGV